MLASLEVRDFAHIAHARLELPAAGFCVLTGETGVGKSLLVDALALALGGRLRRDVVRAGARAAEVSLLFEPADDDPAHAWLVAQGLAAGPGQVVVRRSVDANRRSRVHVNGRLATVAQLAELTAPLLGICGQHEHLQLLAPERRRELLDAAAGATAELAATRAAHAVWVAACDDLAAARGAQAALADRLATLQDSLREFAALDISTARLAEQDRILSMQGNAAELAELHAGLADSLAAAGRDLAASRAAAARLAELDCDCAGLAEQLVALEDLGNDAGRMADRLRGDGVELDASALAEAEAFVAETHRLARKYRLAGPQALPQHMADLEREHDGLHAADVAALERGAAAARDGWSGQAAALGAKRASQAKVLGAKVQAALRQLGMAGARFVIELVPRDVPHPLGAESVELRFAARIGTDLASLGEIASGGELSRVSLALFTHAAGNGGRDLVFDEVDTGIGGKAAAHVGSLLAELGATRLVLCVTHLPQVAAAADVHWQVASVDGAAMLTEVSGTAREEEIARMLAGRKVTSASRANARDILAAAAS